MAASKNPAANLEYWTEFFHGVNGSIFDVIENAILVAANDCPQELRSRRDRIVEKMYTVAIPRCFSCIERCNQQLEEAGSVKHERDNREKKEGPEDIERMVVSGSGGSNCSYEEVEAITEEIERESETVGEVLRIKDILLNKEEQSESSLFESLRRLQLMELSVNTLQATEIGKAVNGLRKHNSKQIRQLVRILIEGWKVLVDEWVGSTALISDKPEGNEYSAPEGEEDGLPSPPLDEGAFLATQTTAIHLDELFDGMDDDGNLKYDTGLEKKREAERKSLSKSNGSVMRLEEPVPAIKQTRPPSLHYPAPTKPPLGNVSKPSIPVNVESGPGRPPRLTQNPSAQVHRKPPAVAQNDRLKCTEDDDRLEAAKKRLHEGYQQAQNAKKQRTIQVLGENEVPKPKVVHQNRFHNTKPRNGIRSWAARH